MRRASDGRHSIERAGDAAIDGTAGSPVWRVLGNSAWLAVSEGATRVISLATILYLTRTLSPSGMGTVQFGLAVFAFMQLVSMGGNEAVLIPEAARRPEELPRLAGRSLLIAGSHFAVAFAVLLAGGWRLRMPADMRWSAAAFGAAAGLAPLALRFAFLATERARVVGLGNIACQLVFFALCLAGVHRPDDVGRVAVFWIAATAMRAVGQLATFVHRHGRLAFDMHGIGRAVGGAAMLGTGSIARGLMLTVDVLVLGLFRPAEEVASYGLATKLPLFVVSLSTLFYMALFPTLARAVASDDAERVARIEAATIEAVLGIALPGAVCLLLVADSLVVWLFTERFRDAAPLLAVLVWRIPLVAATGIFRSAVWAHRPAVDARLALEILGATTLVLVVLARSAGAMGVAVGILAGDAIALVLYVWAAGARGRARIRPSAFARLAAGIAIGAGLTYALPRHAGFPSVAGAVGAWAIASLVADAPYVRRIASRVGRETR